MAWFVLDLVVLRSLSLTVQQQCLCAPTRRDIDLAHLEGRWLDVGVQSMRNLWHIPRKKLALWVCLALSSLPLHLV